MGYKNERFQRAINAVLPRVQERYLYCFSRKNIKYTPKHICYHADEYASFIYLLSNELWRYTGEDEFAEKFYLLNRYLNSLDIFYDRCLPEVFHFEHPIGAIVGRAKIGNYFVLHQAVTVGGNLDLELPVIGAAVVLYAGSMVIGRTVIGDNCQIGAGVILNNQKVENNTTIVFAQTHKVINSHRDFKHHFFKHEN
jgi:serine O-acetyltransferase